MDPPCDGELGSGLIVGTGQVLKPQGDDEATNEESLSGKWRILFDPGNPRCVMMSVEVEVNAVKPFYSILNKKQVMSLASQLSSWASQMKDPDGR